MGRLPGTAPCQSGRSISGWDLHGDLWRYSRQPHSADPMPQTLLALLALVLASLLVFNQQRLATQAQTRMVTDEMELAASGLVSDVMEFAEARSFDEATTVVAIRASGVVPTNTSTFTAAGQFGAADRGATGCNLLRPGLTLACDDVDDLSGLTWVPIEIDLADNRRVPFTVRIAVTYVLDATTQTASSVPTRHKRVSIDVRSPFVRRGTSNVMHITRVISYDPIKTEKDYEDVHGAIGA